MSKEKKQIKDSKKNKKPKKLTKSQMKTKKGGEIWVCPEDMNVDRCKRY